MHRARHYSLYMEDSALRPSMVNNNAMKHSSVVVDLPVAPFRTSSPSPKNVSVAEASPMVSSGIASDDQLAPAEQPGRLLTIAP